MAGPPGAPLTGKSIVTWPIGVLLAPIPKVRNENRTGRSTAGASVEPFQIRATIS
jgi:hypothetical protein